MTNIQAATLTLVLAGWQAGNALAQKAVVIGIRQYKESPATPSLRFPDHDAKLVRSLLQSRIPSQNLITLIDSDAQLDPQRVALKTTLARAGSDELVYIFLSARGIANGNQEGYLGTANLVESKPGSTGLPIRELQDMIRASRAKLVVLFADVYREPESPQVDNRINFRLQDLGNLENLVAVIASNDNRKPSVEDPALSVPAGTKGYGVFGFHLSQAFPAAGTAAGVFERLLKEVQQSTGHRQLPKIIGPEPMRKYPLLPLHTATAHFPDLLASLGFLLSPVPLAMFENQEEMQSEPLEIARALMKRAEPETIVASLNALRLSFSQERWEQIRDATAGQLGALGQNFITRYGVSDLLPEDPRRIRNENFALGERAFREALQLLPDDDVFREYRRTLSSRQHLCGGLKLIYSDQPVPARLELALAQDAVTQPIPEIDNAMGISYLEEGKDYEAAIRYFRSAIAKSPTWAYPRHNMALAYAEWGDSTSAVRAYLEAIKASPAQPYLFYNLGVVFERANRKGEAARTFHRALEVLSGTEEMYRTRAEEWKDPFPEDAAVALARAEQFKMVEADVYNAMGSLEAGRNKYKPARKQFERAREIRKPFCEATHNLGLLELKQAKGKHAREQRLLAAKYFLDNQSACPDFAPSAQQLRLLQ